MGDISKNFNRSEFTCQCGCGHNTVDTELPPILEMTRNHFELIYGVVAVQITCGNRCIEHNKAVGGAENSQHLLGKAADIKVWKWRCRQINPVDVYKYLDKMFPDSLGVGNYESFTHVDVRSEKARW